MDPSRGPGLLTRATGAPYLEGAARERFDRWLDEAWARFSPPLTFPEVRRGAVALSSLYVERRAGGRLAERARAGAGKRAAFATYYAPLHLLTLHHALSGVPGLLATPPARVLDLGCGTGAAGAAVSCTLGEPPEVLALDTSGWALAEARHTLRAFGCPHRTRRGALPAAFPRTGAGDLLALAFVVNECTGREEALLARLVAALHGGARLVLAEPLAGAAAPWWDDWREALAPLGVKEHVSRARVALPAPLAKMDRAAGLDHRELSVRLLAGPL